MPQACQVRAGWLGPHVQAAGHHSGNSLLQELLQAAELEHEVIHINVMQLIVGVAQRLVDEQIHRGGACRAGREQNQQSEH